MAISRRDDLTYSILLTAPLLLYVTGGASSVNAGVWIVMALPLAVLALGVSLRVPALFLTGASIASLVAVLVYLKMTFDAGRDGGLIFLGLFFSSPGMLLGLGVSAWLLKYRIRASLPWILASFGLLGAGLGFMFAQTIVCNTLMYCGALSLKILL